MNQLPGLKHGPPGDVSVPPLVQTAGVGQMGNEFFKDTHERARTPIFCMIQLFPDDGVPENTPYNFPNSILNLGEIGGVAPGYNRRVLVGFAENPPNQ